MEINDMKAIRDALVDIKSEAETTLEYRDYPIAGDPSDRGYCKVVDADYIIEKCDEALSAPPRACDVMSQEDLTKVVISGFIKSLGIGPENQLVSELTVAAISAAIKCAYDTQLVVKKGGEK